MSVNVAKSPVKGGDMKTDVSEKKTVKIQSSIKNVVQVQSEGWNSGGYGVKPSNEKPASLVQVQIVWKANGYKDQPSNVKPATVVDVQSGWKSDGFKVKPENVGPAKVVQVQSGWKSDGFKAKPVNTPPVEKPPSISENMWGDDGFPAIEVSS